MKSVPQTEPPRDRCSVQRGRGDPQQDGGAQDGPVALMLGYVYTYIHVKKSDGVTALFYPGPVRPGSERGGPRGVLGSVLEAVGVVFGQLTRKGARLEGSGSSYKMVASAADPEHLWESRWSTLTDVHRGPALGMSDEYLRASLCHFALGSLQRKASAWPLRSRVHSDHQKERHLVLLWKTFQEGWRVLAKLE